MGEMLRGTANGLAAGRYNIRAEGQDFTAHHATG